MRRFQSRLRRLIRLALHAAGVRPCDELHLDDVLNKISEASKRLWRVVGADGNLLDILMANHQPPTANRHDKSAARRFIRHLLKRPRTAPRGIVTHRFRSYGAAQSRGNALD